MSLPVEPPVVKYACGHRKKVDGMRVAGRTTPEENRQIAQALVDYKKKPCKECQSKSKQEG